MLTGGGSPSLGLPDVLEQLNSGRALLAQRCACPIVCLNYPRAALFGAGMLNDTPAQKPEGGAGLPAPTPGASIQTATLCSIQKTTLYLASDIHPL